MTTEMEVKFKDIPKYGDHMTIEDFMNDVKNNFFIDYDGYGYLATKDIMSNIIIHPSRAKQIVEIEAHKKFTHVVWFNK